jgi:hypothetical protein
MTPIDTQQYYSSIAAGNSSHQLAETMALHQTIKTQVEVTEALHNAIQDQIRVTNKQERSVRILGYAVALLTLIQTVATVIQILPKETDKNPQIDAARQQIERQDRVGLPLSKAVQATENRASSPTKKP